jgi:L-lysine 6-transaminase
MENAGNLGKHFLARLEAIEDAFPAAVENARGRGLLCAFDLPDSGHRDRLIVALREDEHVLALPCGERSIRFRPSLAVTQEEIDVGCDALHRVLARDAGSAAPLGEV